MILLDTNICIHIINARPAAVLQCFRGYRMGEIGLCRSRSTRCWRQPEVVWINPPPPEHGVNAATLLMAA